ncbi:MAG: hypothetical protein ACHQQQ_10330 [Bacteroidota bacterium]
MNTKNATKYLTLILIGFCGMLVTHFVILLLLGFGDTASAHVPYYSLSYPVVYGVLGFILSRRQSDYGVFNALALCAIPCLYWIGIILHDKVFPIDHVSIYDSSGMLLVMPMTVAISMVAMIIPLRKKTANGH